MRSLELKSKRSLTTGMFNLVVKDPITTRARRTLSEHDDTPLGRIRLSSKPFKHTPPFTVLSTYEQTSLTRSTGFGSQIASPNARDMPLQPALAHEKQRTKTPERFNLNKDLVLEVPRFPLTYRSALSPISSPVARAAYLRPSTT